MTRHFVDTDVIVYALGAESPFRAACVALIEMQGAGTLKGETTSLVVQEAVHQRTRQTAGDREAAARVGADLLALYRVHEIASDDISDALRLYVAVPGLDAADAVFAAAASRRGIEVVVSADRGFDDVPGLRRVDPRDTEAVAALAR